MKEIGFATPGGERVLLQLRRVVGAGYTGRDQQSVVHHIEELARAGVAAPPHVPMLFPFIPTLVSQETDTAVLGSDTAPEVEYVVFRQGGRDYVTVGSDQTDSVVEAQSMALAKNCCAKSVATEAWLVSEVADHWDDLRLELKCNAIRMQEGPLVSLLPLDRLMQFVEAHDGPAHEGRMIFSGTLATHGKFPKAEMALEISLHDPALRRTIRHSYTVTPMLPFFG